MFHVDRNQGLDKDNRNFGYVVVGEGGYFFTWNYDRSLSRREQVRQVVATLEPDDIDPPTGRHSRRGVERSLRHYIARHSLLA